MPKLTVDVDDQVWLGVLAVLVARHGPIPDGVKPVAWASEIAAEAFRAAVAEAASPPPPAQPPSRRRIRSSMIH